MPIHQYGGKFMFEEMLVPKIARRIKDIRISKDLKQHELTDLSGVSRLHISAIENQRILKKNKSYLPDGVLTGLSQGLKISAQEIVFGDEEAQKSLVEHIFNLVSIYSYDPDNSVTDERQDEILKSAENKLWHIYTSRAKFSYLFAEIEYFSTERAIEKMHDMDCWPILFKEIFDETRKSIWILAGNKLFESFKQRFISNPKDIVFTKLDEEIINWIDTDFIRIITDLANSRKKVPIYMIGYQVRSLMKFASIQIDAKLRINSPEGCGSLLTDIKKKQGEIPNLSISLIYFDTIKKLINYQEKGLKRVNNTFEAFEISGIYSLYNG
jgi:transcriptional regulator with XRE-family HTH domain